MLLQIRWICLFLRFSLLPSLHGWTVVIYAFARNKKEKYLFFIVSICVLVHVFHARTMVMFHWIFDLDCDACLCARFFRFWSSSHTYTVSIAPNACHVTWLAVCSAVDGGGVYYYQLWQKQHLTRTRTQTSECSESLTFYNRVEPGT